MDLPDQLEQVPVAVADLLANVLPAYDVYSWLFTRDTIDKPSVFVTVEGFSAGRPGCNLAVQLGLWLVTEYTEPANASPALLVLAQTVHDELREAIPSALVTGDGPAIYGDASPAWRLTLEVET